MNTMLLTATDAAGATTLNSTLYLVGYMVLMVAFIYFLFVRPQKKEQKKLQEMVASMEVGDVVVTTSGFYGVLIDITDEDCIVEFGSNKNCRIPMKKSSIAQVEKAEA